MSEGDHQELGLSGRNAHRYVVSFDTSIISCPLVLGGEARLKTAVTFQSFYRATNRPVEVMVTGVSP